jgi:hypothetical protein
MAAFIARNESRFWYTHDTVYVNLKDFTENAIRDYEISSTDRGHVFVKSTVANYIYRPIEL